MLSRSNNEETNTVTIIQDEYILKQGNYQKGKNYVIYTSTLYVKKGFVNHGCNLTVYAAKVVVDQSGGKIDLSGTDGKGFQKNSGQHASTYKRGTYDGEDGQDGANAEDGEDGGDVTFQMGTIEGGTIEINVSGGNGGRAQDGGDGMKGKTPTARSKPNVPSKHASGRKYLDNGVYATTYAWGDDVLTIGEESFSKAYLLVTHKAPQGEKGGDGGNAGLAGKSGNGGAGGTITIHAMADPAKKVSPIPFSGKNAGKAAANGTPGKGAAGGKGAKYLYKADAGMIGIDWSAWDEDAKWDEHWNTKNSKVIIKSVDRFKDLKVKEAYIEKKDGNKCLKLRAKSGAKGNDGKYGSKSLSKPPTPPEARDGKPSSCSLGILQKSPLNIPFSYLLTLERSATTAIINGNHDEAVGFLQWLIYLTDLPEGKSEDDKKRHQMYCNSEETLLMLLRGKNVVTPPRCIYTNIERYSSFVEMSLAHITRQEKFFRKYQAAKENLRGKRDALESSIQEAEEYIKHLTADEITPGSIEYVLEQEK